MTHTVLVVVENGDFHKFLAAKVGFRKNATTLPKKANGLLQKSTIFITILWQVIEPQYVGVYNRTLDSRFGRRKNPSRREPTDPSIIPFFGLSGRQPDRLRQDRRTASPLR